MSNSFNLYSSAQAGIPRPPGWDYIRSGLQRELKTIMDYYNYNPRAVESDHLLVRVLQSIDIPQSQKIERYYDNVDSYALNLSMALKMTSSLYKGTPFNGVFYGKNSVEIIIATDDAFDIYDAEENWQKLQPVTVVRHEISDLSLKIPDGSDFYSDPTLSIFSLNITMLAVMYRSFRIYERDNNDTGSERSIMEFIRMYVLPNILYSQLDLAIFNRANNLLNGVHSDVYKSQHPFYLTDYAHRVDDILSVVIRGFTGADKDFATILRSIPLIDKQDVYELTHFFPDIAPTMQVTWAVLLSALPTLNFVAEIAHVNPGNRNQSDINRVLRMFDTYAVRQVLAHTRSFNNVVFTTAQRDVELFKQNVTS